MKVDLAALLMTEPSSKVETEKTLIEKKNLKELQTLSAIVKLFLKKVDYSIAVGRQER